MSRYTAKICVLGDFAVGKTSTVSRFVHAVFSEKYLTTIGVKIDTKVMTVGEIDLKLVIWDVAGTDKLKTVEFSYLRGAAGYILVCDGTRRDTLKAARQLLAQAQQGLGEVPFVFLVNKSDLTNQWEVTESDWADIGSSGDNVFLTSAKTGDEVERAIQRLAQQVIAREFPDLV
ncbi:MAG: Rab family GTPase [Woeseiaceae bacterium]